MKDFLLVYALVCAVGTIAWGATLVRAGNDPTRLMMAQAQGTHVLLVGAFLGLVGCLVGIGILSRLERLVALVEHHTAERD